MRKLICFRYMADEARNLKVRSTTNLLGPLQPKIPTLQLIRSSSAARASMQVYGELPDTAKINETDTFGEEAQGEGDEFEFEDI